MRKAITLYDDVCRREFDNIYRRVKDLFISIDIGCPYGLPHRATFHQATFAPLNERAMELFLCSGYRRNGNWLYDMCCAECSACVPIRLHSQEFRPGRNQRRSLKKNRDIVVEVRPLRPDSENIELCEKFLRERYPRENNNAGGYFHDFFLNNIVNSAQVEYRIGNRLVGTSIIDIGYNWLNAVYFYFDPDESSRSLGTFNILTLVDICRQWDIEYLYLGYYIESVAAMSYKSNFTPHYLLKGGEWLKEGSI